MTAAKTQFEEQALVAGIKQGRQAAMAVGLACFFLRQLLAPTFRSSGCFKNQNVLRNLLPEISMLSVHTLFIAPRH